MRLSAHTLVASAVYILYKYGFLSFLHQNVNILKALAERVQLFMLLSVELSF